MITILTTEGLQPTTYAAAIGAAHRDALPYNQALERVVACEESSRLGIVMSSQRQIVLGPQGVRKRGVIEDPEEGFCIRD